MATAAIRDGTCHYVTCAVLPRCAKSDGLSTLRTLIAPRFQPELVVLGSSYNDNIDCRCAAPGVSNFTVRELMELNSAFAGWRPRRTSLNRGAWIAVALWIFFLVATGYTSAMSLLDRVQSSDVMRAASAGVWSGKVAWEIAAFLLTQILLHIALAGLTWLLALATARISQTGQQKFGRIVVGWFCVLAGACLAYNALWFPRTLMGAYYHSTMSTLIGPWPLGKVVYIACLMLCLAVLCLALVKSLLGVQRPITHVALSVVSGLSLLVTGALLWPLGQSSASVLTRADQPHILLLGIDSLRLDQLQRYGGKGVTPNLDRFLGDAKMFRDTTTPLARTFSSWMAILTGRAPTVTGARFNLAARDSVKANPTIADVLRPEGYHTVYSTDEVRFANIDQSYGFDQVVTPRIGASDFIVGTYNELPVASVLINTRVGKWLFPFSYANRGVATMFEPATYLDRIDNEVDFDKPTLMVVHLTAAHWPYYTSETPFALPDATPENERPFYRVGLQTADQMFGNLVDLLERKGVFKNAIVVVLSDHGEALRLPSDSFFDGAFHIEGLGAPFKMLDFGHGQSVLSKSQYQVLLAFKSFGRQNHFANDGKTFGFPATVEDISPTLLDALNVDKTPLYPTGVSLWPMLATGIEPDSIAQARVRFTETDLAVLPAPGGGVDEAATARKNSMFFEIEPASGRLQINPDFVPLALAYKERAAFNQDRLLAALPAGPYAHQYIYFDLGARLGRLLTHRPDETEPDQQMLWDALIQHYGDELKPAIKVTPEDWDRIAVEWQQFTHKNHSVQPPPAALNRTN